MTSLTAIDVPMQIIRLTITDSTALDNRYGMPVMLRMFIVLLMPKFKHALIAEESLGAFSNISSPPFQRERKLTL